VKDKAVITSVSNKHVQLARKLLAQKKERDNLSLFVAEGEKVVTELLENATPHCILCSDSFVKSHPVVYESFASTENAIILADALINKISTVASSISVIGIFEKPAYDIKSFGNDKSVIVLCDQVQDPLNIGTIIRSCYCLGADALLLTEGSVDVYNPKVVRATAGYITRIPIMYITHAIIEHYKNNDYQVVVSQVNNPTQSLSDVSRTMREKVLLVFGNEGSGISDRVRQLADVTFSIPLRPKSESLNVATAVAISLYSIIERVKGLQWELT